MQTWANHIVVCDWAGLDVTESDWHSVQVTTDPLKALGEKVREARVQQRYSVKAAATAANMARDTWKRVEAGLGVHDTSRSAALSLLGLDWNGEPVQGVLQPTNWAEEARILLERNRQLERENEELRRTNDETA